jgi:hypothetical protein
MAGQRATELQQRASDQREHERVATRLQGKLFIPAETSTMDCDVVDLSAGGAGVRCEDAPPLETFVVLYVDGFGRFESVATRYVDGLLGLRFLCTDAKRQRLIEKLNVFVEHGLMAATRLRQYERTAPDTLSHFTRANGQQVRCDILDISLQGFSLKTNARPPIDELVRLGRTYGRVVRHHEQGIGVELVSPEKKQGNSSHGT